MIELLSKRIASGDLYINLAVRHLENHEWGLARMAIEEGITRGRLSDPERAASLMRDVTRALGIKAGSPSARTPC